MCVCRYSSTQKGYKCFNPLTNKCIVSRDVFFDDDTLFFQPQRHVPSDWESVHDLFLLPMYTEQDDDVPARHDTQLNEELQQVTNPSNPQVLSQDDVEHGSEDQVDNVQFSQPTQGVRRNPARTRKPSARLLDYVIYASRYPISDVLHYSKYSTSHRAFLTEVSKTAKPRTF
ncbi:hypothetical protein COP1_044552 [Malus domestica]